MADGVSDKPPGKMRKGATSAVPTTASKKMTPTDKRRDDSDDSDDSDEALNLDFRRTWSSEDSDSDESVGVVPRCRVCQVDLVHIGEETVSRRQPRGGRDTAPFRLFWRCPQCIPLRKYVGCAYQCGFVYVNNDGTGRSRLRENHEPTCPRKSD